MWVQGFSHEQTNAGPIPQNSWDVNNQPKCVNTFNNNKVNDTEKSGNNEKLEKKEMHKSERT